MFLKIILSEKCCTTWGFAAFFANQKNNPGILAFKNSLNDGRVLLLPLQIIRIYTS
jgi:hypothetical protein